MNIQSKNVLGIPIHKGWNCSTIGRGHNNNYAILFLFQNEECKHIIDVSRYNESTYLHLYDYVITLTDTEQACEEIIKEINMLDVEKQWVPIDWLPQVDGITNSTYDPANRASQATPQEDRTVVPSQTDISTSPVTYQNADARQSSETLTPRNSPSLAKIRKHLSSPKLRKASPRCSPAAFRKFHAGASPRSYKKLLNSPEDSNCVVTSAEVCHLSSSDESLHRNAAPTPSTRSTLEQRPAQHRASPDVAYQTKSNVQPYADCYDNEDKVRTATSQETIIEYV